jgi:hypothetical protein
MRSLFQKSLISSGILIVSLVLAGNAMAANSHVKARTTAAQTSYRPTVDVAAIPPYPNYSSSRSSISSSRGGFDVAAHPSYSYPAAPYAFAGPGINVGQLIGAMLGGLPPQYAQIVRNAERESASHRYAGSSESSGYSPTYDSPAVEVDNSQSQAAIDAADQAMQQEDQSLQDLDASIAAAEQQNDAANAAALQTEINAGM